MNSPARNRKILGRYIGTVILWGSVIAGMISFQWFAYHVASGGFWINALTTAAPVGAIALFLYYTRHMPEPWHSRLPVAMIAIFAGIGMVLIGIFVIRNVLTLIRALPTASAKAVGTALTLTGAGGLFAFRFYARAFWGLGEVIVALIAAWNVIPNDSVGAWDIPKSLTGPVIGGSLYLAIRGMDNIQQGYSNDKLLNWLRTGIGRLTRRR